MRRIISNKVIAGIVGLIIGMITIPILAILWPFLLACFLSNETDDESNN
jgi:hypothetical protein